MMDALSRQWCMLQSIPRLPNKISAPNLRERLLDMGHRTTLRTIQRDLIKLSAIFPLVCDEYRPAGWSYSKDARVYDIPGMDPTTALTFSLVEKFLHRMLPPSAIAYLTPHFTLANGVLKAAKAGGAGSWAKKVRVTSRTISLMPPAIRPEILAAVYDSLLNNRRFAARYQKAHDHALQEYEVNPLGLVFADQIIYLVCTLWDYEEPVRLALQRFREIWPLQKPARAPKGFRIEEFLGDRPLEIKLDGGLIALKVLFDKVAAFHLTETPLSSDQRLAEQPDGRVLLTATIQDSAQLHWWLLAFGDQVEVVAPRPLRDQMAQVAGKMAKNYSTDL